jgi:UDPglucose 6-dehydrogenase
MNIAVIGTGYVGLVAGTCFAEMGNDVICVDKNIKLIKQLRKGIPHIYEPGMEDMLKRNLKDPSGVTKKRMRLSFTRNLISTVQESDIVFIAVDTPMEEDGTADLSAVKKVAHKIGEAMKGYKIIINKSTVPVGTGKLVSDIIKEHYPGQFDVVSNPEFLKEGDAINDFMKPNRVIVGYDQNSPNKDQIQQTFRQLYRPFMMTTNRLMFMGRESAELTKYGANAMLATRISFMNELAKLSERVGADIDQVRKGIGSDKRIGPSFLFAGPGYGGSCFPKDVSALNKTGIENDVHFNVIAGTERANKLQKEFFFRKIIKYYNGDVGNKTFAIWGLAFKANTDDIRMSPAIYLAHKLAKLGARIKVYDPQAMPRTKSVLGKRIEYTYDEYSAINKAHALIVMTDWNEFRNPNFKRLRDLKDKIIFDSRNLYSIDYMKTTGLNYISVGRPDLIQ